MKQYINDLGVDGALFAAIVRSPISCGRITEVCLDDKDKGECIIVDAKSIPGKNAIKVNGMDVPLLCGGDVLYKGEGVAVVLADSFERAREAAARAKVSVEFKVKGGGTAAALRLARGTDEDNRTASLRRVQTGIFESGNKKKIEAVFSGADKAVTSERTLSPCVCVPSETSGALCVRSEEDGQTLSTILCPTSSTPRLRSALCRMLDESGEDITVQVTARHDEAADYQTDIIALQAALCSAVSKKSVKLMLTRAEDAKYNQNPVIIKVKHTAAIKDSRIAAVKVEVLSDIGAFNPFVSELQDCIIDNCIGMYDHVQNVFVCSRVLYSYRPPTGFDAEGVASIISRSRGSFVQFSLQDARGHLRSEVLKAAVNMSDFSRKYVAYKMANPLDGVRRGIGVCGTEEAAVAVEVEADTVLGSKTITRLWAAVQVKGEKGIDTEEAILVAIEKDVCAVLGTPLPVEEDGTPIAKIAFLEGEKEGGCDVLSAVHSAVLGAIDGAFCYVGVEI